MAAAGASLEPDVQLLAPRAVVALGKAAARALLPAFAKVPMPQKSAMESLVRRLFTAAIAGRSTPIMVVYHPAFAFAHAPAAPASFAWAGATVREILAEPSTVSG